MILYVAEYHRFETARAEIRVSDDTMYRRVSSDSGLSGPYGHEIRGFDDTMRRVVSSVLEIIEPHGPKSGFLMILCVAWYHQILEFETSRTWNPGF